MATSPRGQLLIGQNNNKGQHWVCERTRGSGGGGSRSCWVSPAVVAVDPGLLSHLKGAGGTPFLPSRPASHTNRARRDSLGGRGVRAESSEGHH